MKASLDTNAIIHFYRADLQEVLFNFFDDGVMIYEQIHKVELEHHGQDVLRRIDKDIASGWIEVYTDQKLKEQAIYRIFENNVKDNRNLYGSGDLGEVYAISLAQTLGVYSLVTDDIKQGGPYMSLLQFEDEIMPFTFAEILILRYLIGQAEEVQTVNDFDRINNTSNMNWSFQSHLAKFIRRFFTDPYRTEDTIWIQKLTDVYGIKLKSKLQVLRRMIGKDEE